MSTKKVPKISAVLLVVALPFLALLALAQATAPAKSPVSVTLAKGVTFTEMSLKSPAGEPWRAYVLRVERGARGVQIRAASAPGEMRRELPSEIAKVEVKPGEELLAVVNGDYDLPAPYLGISDGLSITSGHLWTTGKTTWPAFAVRKNGEPLIGVPQVRVELAAGKKRRPALVLNKPIGSAHGNWPRAFTRDFRASVKSGSSVRAVAIGKLAPPLPLRANQKVRGEVLEVLESVKEVSIPPDAIVIAGPPLDGKVAFQDPYAELMFAPGQKVEFRVEVEIAGRRDIQNAVGGFPIVVRGGKREIVGTPGANLKLRHPRTAVCYNQREIIFVVVDGRQPQISVGMTLEELGDLMVSLGCTEAMNTDGGGSSVMAVTMPPATGATNATIGPASQADGASRSKDRPLQGRGPLQIVNSPSDGKERGRGNAWVIVKRP